MKCPRCGYQRQLRDNAYVPRNECPSCGVVYSRSDDEAFIKSSRLTLPISGQKSPVDESSLLKARERVESRLRKQLETRLKDERHQQTLARAKEFASAEIRKRQEAWERKRYQAPADTEPPTRHQAQEPDLMENASLSTSAAEDTLSEMIPADFNASDTLPTAWQRQASDARAAQARKRVVTPKHRRPTPNPNTTLGAASSKSERPTRQAAPRGSKTKGGKVLAIHNETGKIEEIEAVPIPEPSAIAAGRHSPTPLSRFLTRTLPAVAWLILIAGIIGAVLSWTTIQGVEASVATTNLSLGQGILPLGLLLGFAYLATGVLGFAFFWVTTMISRQLKDIRRLLLSRPQS